MAVEKTTGPAALVLTATVARRYYLEGESKSDIAASLGLSRFKVARLLDRALETGLVKIEIDSQGEIDLNLSVRLAAEYGLHHCIVMNTDEQNDAQLRAVLGRAAAELLTEIVEPGDVLGLSWARSLMAMRTALTSLPRCDVVQFDERGEPVYNALTDRLIGIEAELLLAVPEIVAIAYGERKAPAVSAAMRSHLITSIVTHAAMGRALLELS